jgi:hypothetical protein
MPAQKRELKKLRKNQILVEDRDLLKTNNPISVSREKKGEKWLYTFTLNSEKDSKHRWSPKIVINNKKIFNFKVLGENYAESLQMYKTEVWRRHSDVMLSKKLTKYDTGPDWISQRKEYREKIKKWKKTYSTKNYRPVYLY